MSAARDDLAAPEEFADRYRVRPGSELRLQERSTGSTAGYDSKRKAHADLKRYTGEINDLARILAAEAKRAVLVILQGADASGKDGLVRHVFTGVNPQVCKVTSFVEPDAEERSHDYLWRIYRAAPAAGTLAIFNRSHYEDVLVPRAHASLSTEDTDIRMRQIVDLERTWFENGIIPLKFFLHISLEEQARRFKARLDTPDKHWKVKESDFSDRKLWPQFEQAYNDVIPRTAHEHAPWYVIPSDHKWYRNVAIASIVLHTLRGLGLKYPQPDLDLGKLRGLLARDSQQ